MDFFYFQQLRQYRIQVINAFSNFYVSYGKNPDGTENLHQVPCKYGDSSRLAESIILGGSENKLPNAPFISVYVTGLHLNPERRQAPSLVSPVLVDERKYNENTQSYGDTPGNRYTVLRHMPVPFTLDFHVDFWTTNLDQKEQLLEQTQVIFNGAIDIQTSTNPLDWTVLTTLEPTNITWSSRTIPMGTDNPIDVATVEYKLPIWINPPAKVQYQKIIQNINTKINKGGYNPLTMEWNKEHLLTRQIHTPHDSSIELQIAGENRYEISLRNAGGDIKDFKHHPTKITGNSNPILIPGTVFKLNGNSITVPNSNIDDLITVVRRQIPEHLNILLNLESQIEIWNHTGKDITLENVVGNQVEALGFLPIHYKGGTLAWWRYFDSLGFSPKPYSSYKTSASQIRIGEDKEKEIIGYIQPHPTNQNLIFWYPDMTTWPSETMKSITAVIDPQTSWPEHNLSEPRVGQRYLLIKPIAKSSEAWGSVCCAEPNDIIEWTGFSWETVFVSSVATNKEWVLNQYSQKWLKWDDGEWSVFPEYSIKNSGWRLML